MAESLTFLLVEDHPLVRTGMAQILRRLDAGATVLEANHCEQALGLCRAHPELDLVLLDLGLPGMNGLDGLAQFRQAFPAVPVVILSASENTADIRQAMARGAQGYLPKSTPAELMEQALRLVLEGGHYLPPSLLALDDPAGAATASAALSPRQRQVLVLLADGLSNKEIGRQLDLSENTVRAHAAAIFRVLGVRNRTEAARVAREQGLVGDR